MENKNIKKASVLAVGALALGSVNAKAAALFNAEDLGSAFEVRTSLIEQNALISSNVLNATIELKCGKAGRKSGEQGCGEKVSKERPKTEASAKEKAKEHKCGEGKCGEKGKGEVKSAAKAKGKEKAKEHKCGDAKCGGK